VPLPYPISMLQELLHWSWTILPFYHLANTDHAFSEHLTNQLTYQIEKRNTKQKSKKPSMYHWKLELIQVRLWFLLLVGITHKNVSSSEILQHSLYHLGNKGSITQKHYIFYLQQSLAFFRQQSIIITKKKTLNKVKLAHRWGRRLRERREQKI